VVALQHLPGFVGVLVMSTVCDAKVSYDAVAIVMLSSTAIASPVNLYCMPCRLQLLLVWGGTRLGPRATWLVDAFHQPNSEERLCTVASIRCPSRKVYTTSSPKGLLSCIVLYCHSRLRQPVNTGMVLYVTLCCAVMLCFDGVLY
jgi:hypothetical protein